MSDSALTVLKFCLMALLYLFLARVVWVVASEMRSVKPLPAAPEPPPPAVTASSSGSAKGKKSKRRWNLTVIAPKAAAGTVYAIEAEITIGRAPGCAITLPADSFASSLHARAYPRDGAVWVEDLASTNGTTVNGGRLTQPVRLKKGDRVQIGDTVLEVRR